MSVVLVLLFFLVGLPIIGMILFLIGLIATSLTSKSIDEMPESLWNALSWPMMIGGAILICYYVAYVEWWADRRAVPYDHL